MNWYSECLLGINTPVGYGVPVPAMIRDSQGCQDPQFRSTNGNIACRSTISGKVHLSHTCRCMAKTRQGY